MPETNRYELIRNESNSEPFEEVEDEECITNLNPKPVDKRKPWKCNDCMKGFKAEEALEKHVKIHENILFPCEVEECDKLYTNYKSLKIHTVNKHRAEHQCNVCNKELGSNYNLKRHIAKVHTNIVNFGETYFSMEDHVVKVAKKSFACDYCTKTYSR